MAIDKLTCLEDKSVIDVIAYALGDFRARGAVGFGPDTHFT